MDAQSIIKEIIDRAAHEALIELCEHYDLAMTASKGYFYEVTLYGGIHGEGKTLKEAILNAIKSKAI